DAGTAPHSWRQQTASSRPRRSGATPVFHVISVEAFEPCMFHVKRCIARFLSRWEGAGPPGGDGPARAAGARPAAPAAVSGLVRRVGGHTAHHVRQLLLERGR